MRGYRALVTTALLHEPYDPKVRGYVKIGLVLPGVSYWYLSCVHDWTAEQQIHHLFATLRLGGRHCLVGFFEVNGILIVLGSQNATRSC